jgi:hypothetical protein
MSYFDQKMLQIPEYDRLFLPLRREDGLELFFEREWHG